MLNPTTYGRQMNELHRISLRLNRVLREYKNRNEYPKQGDVADKVEVQVSCFQQPRTAEGIGFRRRIIRAQLDWCMRNPDKNKGPGVSPKLSQFARDEEIPMKAYIPWTYRGMKWRLKELPKGIYYQCDRTNQPATHELQRKKPGGDWQHVYWLSDRAVHQFLKKRKSD